MSATEGFKIGKIIFDILKNNVGVQSKLGGASNITRIQPAPLKQESIADTAVIYEINAVNPVNIKRYLYRSETAPLFVVDFSLEIISKDYSDGILLADACAIALQEATDGTYNSVKCDGITLQSMSEDYNKARRYYSKDLSFQARVLL
jgi:putative alpha-1,2-mannosidase